MTVSVVVGSGRLFVELILGAVCIGVNGQFLVLRSTLYSRALGCAPNPFVTVNTMYLALGMLKRIRRLQTSMAQTNFHCFLFDGCEVIRPVGTPTRR